MRERDHKRVVRLKKREALRDAAPTVMASLTITMILDRAGGCGERRGIGRKIRMRRGAEDGPLVPNEWYGGVR